MEKEAPSRPSPNFAAKKIMENSIETAPSQASGLELLARARECWMRAARFRADRDRCKRFTYGDQWSDYTEVGNGVRLSEEEQLRIQGNMPLKNNLIRRLVRNVLGVFRNRWQPPVPLPRDPSEAAEAATLKRLIEYNLELNRLEEVYARSMEEFLISGLAVHKKWFGRRGNISDCWTDIVPSDRFFWDSEARDIRGWDMNLVGEIHEMEFSRLCASFSRTPADRERIARIYGVDFRNPPRSLKCELTEIWLREHSPRWYCHDRMHGRRFEVEEADYRRLVEQENARRLSTIGENALLIDARWMMSDQWRYFFISPSGDIIDSGVSPYQHGSHPYIIKAYPFIDAEIHSFVSDVIDQQKLTNRLITMYDWILRASAKGVLLFPEGALPDGCDMNEIAEEWSRFNGVIIYKARAGVPIPQQVSSNSTNIGITGLLEIQMKMMEDISGVNGALQGKLDSNSMSGTLYNQQTQNSLTALADLMRSFEDFIGQGVEMDIANIRQFYTPRRIAAITGSHPGLATTLRPARDFFHTPFDIRINGRTVATTAT